MKKLVVLMAAASALAPASAMAQRTAAPPVQWEDTPHAQMRAPMPRASMPPAPPSPGMSGHGPAMHPPMAPPPPHAGMHHPPLPGAGAPPMMAHRGGDRMRMRHHGARNFSNYHRIDRGFVLPQPWWGPQFQISNWSMYGLPQPIPGGRWIRYYDDALMVDGYGRVMDGRWGMSWDQWQDQWDYDDQGVPVYVGNGDFYPGDEDYAWVDGNRGAYGYDERYGYGYGAPCQQTCTTTYAYPAYPSPYGYGWGWGYGAGTVVTETTITTAPTVVTETYYEEQVVQRRAHKARKYRARCNCARPRPLPGERG